MILLGLSGKRRSGKTLLANILASDFGYIHLSLAKVLKEEVRELYGLSQLETDGIYKEQVNLTYKKTPRQIMIEHGLMRRNTEPNYWIKRLRQQILDTKQAQLRKFVISDIRFPNEADWIKNHHGYLVRLERAIELTGNPINDPSETSLDNYDGFDLLVPESWNVDLEDMKETSWKVASNVDLWYGQRTGN